jgi:16S rRNA (guanine1207-N2)-methyltransferase
MIGDGVDAAKRKGVYGSPLDGLKLDVADGLQLSPLLPGAQPLEDLDEGALEALIMVAPPGTVERRSAMASGLRALEPGAPFTIVAPKDKGGSRLGDELTALGCSFEESGKRHHRICVGARPEAPIGLDEAIAAGAPRFVETLGLWSQPGVFSWDRLDPGSALLIETLPALAGRGADFGCGIGVLSHAVLKSSKVKALTLIDVDRRAVEAARRNVDDSRVDLRWADLRTAPAGLANLDFVVMNPPFHQGGIEDQGLGQSFVATAAKVLRRGGSLWLVANRHLPYEGVLKPLFARVEVRAEERGFKVFEARR